MSLSALKLGRARDAFGHAVFVKYRAPNSASMGSGDMYYFSRRGRVMGLQWITRFILKQLRSVSYTVSRGWSTISLVQVVGIVFVVSLLCSLVYVSL